MNGWYKIVDKIITRYLQNHLESNHTFSRFQAGFRRKKSCLDHILTLELLIEIAKQQNQELHVVLVDLQKAFDSVRREDIFTKLEDTGFDQTATNILKSAYNTERSRLLLCGQPRTPFNIEIGVRQGA